MANSDFSQKLLNDLRMRKQRMAAAQNSSQSSLVPAGAYENSRKTFKGSGEIRILDMIGSKMGSSMYKGSAGSSQRSLVLPQASNQIIVPYGKAHNSDPTIELSTALAHAFDPNEMRRSKNKMDFTTGSAFLGFLQQIGSSIEWVSMERTRKGSNMQWSSSDRYPTLTNLHINEISKGAQKLNQILRACSNGINIDSCSVEIGKELLKGAIDLEESLNMLVNLQEASEYKIGTQTRSQIKLLEEDEDEDEDNRSVTENKHVERPVFSFDKHSKKKKGFTQTGMKQNSMALPYSNEAGNVRKPEKQVSLKPGHNSHRRTASSQADFDASLVVLAPYRIGTSQIKHETGKGPSVIAKLMGLEEPPPEVNELKVKANNQTISNQKLEGLLSTRTANRSSRSTELKSEDVKKYTILGANKKEIQSSKIVAPAFNSQDTGNHINVANDTKTRWTEEENAKKPQELIFKINELSRYMHQNQTSGRPTGIGDVMKADEHNKHKKEDVKKNNLWRTGHTTNQSPEAAERLQGERSSTENSYAREKRNASKLPVNVSNQQKKQKDLILHPPHMPPSDQPQGKKQTSEERQQHRVNKNRTQGRQTNASPAQRKKSAKATHELKNLQKSQPPTKQADKSKQTVIEANTIMASLQSPINRKNEKIAANESSPRYDQKPKDSRMPGSENHATMTDKETKSRVRKASSSLKNDKIAPKSAIPHKATEVMAKTRTASKTLRPIKHETTILYGMNAKQLEKISKSKGDAVMNISKSQGDAVMNITKSQQAAEMNISNTLPADTSTRAKNEEESTQSINEASQEQIKAENVRITYDAKKDDVQHFDEFDTTSPLNNKKQPFIASTNQVHQEAKPKTTALNQAKDVYEDRVEILSNIQEKQKLPPKAEIQEPLTEEEVHLKQILITSHLFLNTAEAFFKLNIPVTILNATDYVFHKNESKILIDTGYEVMKRKARRQEHCLYTCMKISRKGITVHSLDDLVKQLHGDIEILRHYGRKMKEDNEYDDADYLINMLERDLHSWDPDVNCMWDLEWSDLMFAYVEMDEVIRDVEKCLLDELLDEVTKDIGVKK